MSDTLLVNIFIVWSFFGFTFLLMAPYKHFKARTKRQALLILILLGPVAWFLFPLASWKLFGCPMPRLPRFKRKRRVSNYQCERCNSIFHDYIPGVPCGPIRYCPACMKQYYAPEPVRDMYGEPLKGFSLWSHHHHMGSILVCVVSCVFIVSCIYCMTMVAR